MNPERDLKVLKVAMFFAACFFLYSVYLTYKVNTLTPSTYDNGNIERANRDTSNN